MNPFTLRKRRREQEEWLRAVTETKARINHLSNRVQRIRALINKHTGGTP